MRTLLIVPLVALLSGLPSGAVGQEESLRAAATLTGLTTGMAAACKIPTRPVLYAFRDLMDRKRVLGTERKRLVALVSRAHDRSFATQHEPGAMSCGEVQDQVTKTIRRLRRAK